MICIPDECDRLTCSRLACRLEYPREYEHNNDGVFAVMDDKTSTPTQRTFVFCVPFFLLFLFFCMQMEKFTGADLTEICQRAAKIAIRENIMKVGRRQYIL